MRTAGQKQAAEEEEEVEAPWKRLEGAEEEEGD